MQFLHSIVYKRSAKLIFSTGKVLFLAFFDICRLVKKPQDIPASKNLLILCLFIYLLLSIFIADLYQETEKAILGSFVELGLLLLFNWAILQSSGKSARWLQTVTALIGTNLIINFFALPSYLLVSIDANNEITTASTTQSFGLLMLAAMACWNIVIMAHILRHALGTHFAIAMFLAITYIWIAFSFTSAILPEGTN